MSSFVPALRSELRKVRSVRTLMALPVGAVIYVLLSFLPAVLAPESARATIPGDALVGGLRGPGFVLAVVMLLLGALAAAGEHRHRTAAATLLVTPRRRDVVVAKLGATMVVASVTALAVVALSL